MPDCIISDVTIQEVVAQYESRILELQSATAQVRWPDVIATAALVIAIALFLALSVYAIRGQSSFWWLSLPIAGATGSIRRLRLTRQSKSRLWRLKRFYDRAIQRVNGNWASSGFTGEEFIDPNHVYATDLNVVGEGSLFELLCIVRTSLGRRGLADYLLQTPALDESALRQEAVRELRGRTNLRERIATLGEFEFLETQHATFDQWLTSPRLSFPSALPVIAAATSALLVAIVVAGLLGVVPWMEVARWAAPFILFHTAVGLAFRDRVNRMSQWLRPVSLETRVLREGLHLVETEPFESAKLRQISGQLQTGSRSIRQLERLLDLLAERDKDWFAGPSRLLLAGTQLCMAIERWQRKHGQSLRTWIEAWAEFEALNALAAYGYENPENAFPELAAGPACFQARDLGHPLLPPDSCITNDVEITTPESPFYIVSGSNMSGKSTLLRAIGLNAVLAFAGAPVRAGALRLSGLSIFASLSIVDSLLNGKSKFLAEVDRLRQAIESAVPDRPVLFLVDEIFSGTNSRDRRIAAEAIVRTLVDRGAIGALSTHDLALTEIAGADGLNGVNVHMGSRDHADPMDFDYRLKPGVTTESNALAIARMAGVPV
jgi:ABC-type multidrug transport system fused ATPase/permease subunit